MKLAALALAVAACGPGLKPRDPRDGSKQTLASAAGDAGAIGELLRGSVVNGGLWFDDASCAAQFGTTGEVGATQLPAFAKCLATLRLTPSARNDALGDVVVMEYAPGFEVQIRIVEEHMGPRIAWIGFASRRNDQDNAPTLTSTAVEALRLTGDRHGPLDPAVAAELEREPEKRGFTWVKFCLDETGAVREAVPFETTSTRASDASASAAKTWTFRPFTIRGTPMRVCSMARMAFPPTNALGVETLPLPPPPSRGKRPPIVFAAGSAKLIEGRRISGNRAITPNDLTRVKMRQDGLRQISGSFRVCIDEAGAVESVLPLRSTGFAAYDQKILGSIRLWRYSPYQIDDQPVPVCTAVTFIYKM